jgi:ferredoxin
MVDPVVLSVAPEKCAGCRACQCVCALHHFKVINYNKSRIRVEGRFPEPRFDIIYCRQCGTCAEACELGAIIEKRKRYIIDEKKCNNCGMCIDACPQGALFVHKDFKFPLKCDLCLQCIKFCPTGALTTVKPERGVA